MVPHHMDNRPKTEIFETENKHFSGAKSGFSFAGCQEIRRFPALKDDFDRRHCSTRSLRS